MKWGVVVHEVSTEVARVGCQVQRTPPCRALVLPPICCRISSIDDTLYQSTFSNEQIAYDFLGNKNLIETLLPG